MLKVEAVDRDKGINDVVTYSISSESLGGPGGGSGQGGVGGRSEHVKHLSVRLHEAHVV